MQEKLMKLNDYSDGSSHWRVACDCGDCDHDVSMFFEAEKDFTDVSLNVEMRYGAFEKWGNFFKRWPWRIKTAAKILFTGHYTFVADVILDDKGIKAMQTALDNGLAHIKKCKAEQDAARAARLANKSA